jgi:F420-dependent oxidoreductase-like protein
MLEAYTLLSALAARTKSASLGTMVTGVTYRNPALLAKIVTTLDVISSGRAILGIGAAWNDDEHAGYGYDFPSAGERLDRLEEALQITRAMFTEQTASFQGSHYRIQQVLNNPKPIRGRIPVLIGGGGEKRTLKLVAQYGDACNLFGGPDAVRHKLDVLERHCADVGRDPAEITKTALATVRDPVDSSDFVASLIAVGIDGVIVNMPDVTNLDKLAATGEALRKVLP